MTLFMEIMGWFGAILVLGGYGLLSMKKLESDTYLYHWINISGALCLGVYAVWHDALASAAVNIIWMAIGLLALRSIWKRATTKTLVAE